MQQGRFIFAPAWVRKSPFARRIMLAAIVLIVIIAGSLIMWRKLQFHVAGQPEYLVAAENVEITPPPAWIHTDIKAEVVRDAGLTKKISILDEHAPQRLSEAFALDPWVERVAGVHTSYPAHIRIDLIYRHPVGMVEVSGGLLPVDAQSVLLPTAGFSATEAQSYPRIAGVTTSPLGVLGTPWGDAVVEQAAKVAALLQGVWQPLRLHHIQAQPIADGDGSGGTALQLVTRGGAVFLWGAAPGNETDGEAKAAGKLARLEKLAAEFKTLDAVPSTQHDLRRMTAVP
jgi:hypothetical protein